MPGQRPSRPSQGCKALPACASDAWADELDHDFVGGGRHVAPASDGHHRPRGLDFGRGRKLHATQPENGSNRIFGYLLCLQRRQVLVFRRRRQEDDDVQPVAALGRWRAARLLQPPAVVLREVGGVCDAGGRIPGACSTVRRHPAQVVACTINTRVVLIAGYPASYFAECIRCVVPPHCDKGYYGLIRLVLQSFSALTVPLDCSGIAAVMQVALPLGQMRESSCLVAHMRGRGSLP